MRRIVLSAQDARQGAVILNRPWQRVVFFTGLAVPVLLLLLALFFPSTGH
jgi:hypothetical protein